jgi:hypothetical protein
MGEYRHKEKLSPLQVESITSRTHAGGHPIFVREAMDGSLVCGSSKLTDEEVETCVLKTLVPPNRDEMLDFGEES